MVAEFGREMRARAIIVSMGLPEMLELQRAFAASQKEHDFASYAARRVQAGEYAQPSQLAALYVAQGVPNPIQEGTQLILALVRDRELADPIAREAIDQQLEDFLHAFTVPMG